LQRAFLVTDQEARGRTVYTGPTGARTGALLKDMVRQPKSGIDQEE